MECVDVLDVNRQPLLAFVEDSSPVETDDTHSLMFEKVDSLIRSQFSFHSVTELLLLHTIFNNLIGSEHHEAVIKIMQSNEGNSSMGAVFGATRSRYC